MPEPEAFTGAEMEELEALIELTRLRGWRIVKNLFHKHRLHCVEQAHKCLKSYQDRKAGEWLAKSDEPARLITLIQTRKDELEKKRGET